MGGNLSESQARQLTYLAGNRRLIAALFWWPTDSYYSIFSK